MSQTTPIGNAKTVSFWEENKKACIAGAAITFLVTGILTLLFLQRSGKIDLENFIKNNKKEIATGIAIGIPGVGIVFCWTYKCCKNEGIRSVNKNIENQSKNSSKIEEVVDNGVIGTPAAPGQAPLSLSYEGFAGQYHEIKYYRGATVGQIKERIDATLAPSAHAYNLDIIEQGKKVKDSQEFTHAMFVQLT